MFYLILELVLFLYLIFLIYNAFKITRGENYIYVDIYKKRIIANRIHAILFSIVHIILFIAILISLYKREMLMFLLFIFLYVVYNEIEKSNI